MGTHISGDPLSSHKKPPSIRCVIFLFSPIAKRKCWGISFDGYTSLIVLVEWGKFLASGEKGVVRTVRDDTRYE